MLVAWLNVANIHTYVQIYILTYVCLYVHMCTHMYVYIHFMSINIFERTLYVQDSKRCENSYNIIVYII